MNDYLPWLGFALALLVIWFAGRAWMRKQRAQETEAAVHGDYAAYLLEVLANAAKIDGRVDEAERQAITDVMTQVKGAPFAREAVDAALTRVRLGKEELVAYLAAKANVFSTEQKTTLLKGVLSVAMADGHFDGREHAIYLDYIAAIGFERKGAPEMLQGWVRDLAAGKYS
jgi:uncharacterized membrane protein YebE (DUF533 family)